jgi:hypothetical protein
MMLLSKFTESGLYPGWNYRATGVFFNGGGANQADVTITSSNLVDGTRKIVGLNQRTSTAMIPFINGTENPTQTMNLPVSTTPVLNIGSRSTGSPLDLAFNGSLNEVLIYIQSLSLAQCQQLEGYLAWKWGAQSNLTTSNHPYYLSKPLVVPFTPLQISGCLLWLDAADQSTIQRTGSTLTGWTDKSPGARTIALTGTLTWASDAIVTSPSRNAYIAASVNVQKSAVPNLTAILVYKWLGYGSNVDQVLWGCDVPNGNSRVQILSFPVYSEGAYGFGGGAGVGSVTTSAINTPNQLIYVAGLSLGGASRIALNGTQQASFTEGPANLDDYPSWYTVYFGTGELSASSFNSYVSFNEILFFSSNLSAADQQRMEGYLAAKWGLRASIPSTHPYKTFKP